MKLVTGSKAIGVTHSLTQLFVIGLYSRGAIFLLPLALAEITGWVLLMLWTGLNFLGLPIIIKVLDKYLTKRTRSLALFNILITAFAGGFLGFTLYLSYYKFHMFYIKKEFNLSDYFNDFPEKFITLSIIIIIGEFIRLKRSTL